jgi:aldose 1-epimerase
MQATTDRTTLVNMAHHSYWNLGGYDRAILDHELTLTPIELLFTMVPSGGSTQSRPPFDFTHSKPIGRDLKQAGGTPIGYDQLRREW